MKITFIISTFLVIAIFNLLGCHSAPIQERGIRASHDKKLDYTEEDVAKLIMRAGASTPWRLEQNKPAVVLATYYRPLEDGKISYSASVTITYTRKSYSIQYHSSTGNLQYGQGEIHENYNNWVKNLDNAIRREMLID